MNDTLIDVDDFCDSFVNSFVESVREVRRFTRGGVVESLRAKDAMYQGAILIKDEIPD